MSNDTELRKESQMELAEEVVIALACGLILIVSDAIMQAIGYFLDE